MKEVITRCDKCLRPGATNFGKEVGRRADAAGGMENIILSCDLCIDCHVSILSGLVGLLDINVVKQELLKYRDSKNKQLFTES